MNIQSNSSEPLAGIPSVPVTPGLPAQTEFRFANALQAVQPAVPAETIQIHGEIPRAADCVLETLRQQATEAPIFAANPMVVIKTPVMESIPEAQPEVAPVAVPEATVVPARGKSAKKANAEEPVVSEEQPAEPVVRDSKRKKSPRSAAVELPVVVPSQEHPSAVVPAELPPQASEPEAQAPELQPQTAGPVASRLPLEAAQLAPPAEDSPERPHPPTQVDATAAVAPQLPSQMNAPAEWPQSPAPIAAPVVKTPELAQPSDQLATTPVAKAPEGKHQTDQIPAPIAKAPEGKRQTGQIPAPVAKAPEGKRPADQIPAPVAKAPEGKGQADQILAPVAKVPEVLRQPAAVAAPIGKAPEVFRPAPPLAAPVVDKAPELPHPSAQSATPAAQSPELAFPVTRIAAAVNETPDPTRPAAQIPAPVDEAPESPLLSAQATSPEPVELSARMPGLTRSMATQQQEASVVSRPVLANDQPPAPAETPGARLETPEVERSALTPPAKKTIETQLPLERLLAPFAQPVTAVAFEAKQPAMPVETKVGSRDYQPLLEGKLPGSIRDLVVRELSGGATQPAQAAPAQRPLLAELMQRIQATAQPVPTLKMPVETAVTRPGLEPLMALLSEKKATSEQGSDEDQQAEPESDQPTGVAVLHHSMKSEAPVEAAAEVKAPVKVLDQVEHGQHLARLQGKALIEKPRELEVQLHSEKLGAVAARVKVEAGGQWTAHVQLRDAEVERSVRQELVQIQETRGLEGFTTSLSQDQRDPRGSFQGFSFDQQQRGPHGYAQKKSVNPSTFEDPLPIERVSSANGNSNGLNVRA